MQNVKVSFEPTTDQMATIKEWLFIEDEKKKFDGFYCNWNSIEYSWERNEIAIILNNEVPIGFITWWLSDKVAKIQIAEIKPGFRKKGYGRLLTETTLNRLKGHGIMVSYLHCQPAKSENTWTKIGFSRFPDVPSFKHYNNGEEGRHLYRILVPHLEINELVKTDEQIQLWSVERYEADKYAPQWEWQLSFDKGSRRLVKPIIFPANCKWNIRWVRNNETIKSDEIKYFSKQEIAFNNFVIIEEMAAQ